MIPDLLVELSRCCMYPGYMFTASHGPLFGCQKERERERERRGERGGGREPL